MIPLSLLIIANNTNLSSLLSWHLQQVGYSVYQSLNLGQARSLLPQYQPSITILDLDISDESLEFCYWLAKQKRTIIFLISSRSSEMQIVAGLKAGADDFLAKPFGIQEFLARVEVLSRRIKVASSSTYLDYGHLKIDLVQRRVRLKGSIIDLTPQEFVLLYVLAQAEGEPISRSELLQKAWPDEVNNPRTVDTHILSLRKKVELDPQQPRLIQTVRNVGYRFNLEAILGRSPSQRAAANNASPLSPDLSRLGAKLQLR
ncbi:response regulator with CheY-like receiver domain and winged-helix DNA-binding domain [Synechococcus sp. PCC 7502]|uniref:response regulator transcription factor n=1 Tax=Synechococcus sp. PCC 7502 TaxID=1173263 RepID=UPI00029F8B9C|nr:response regulator transcription factor [Synechococcus sp. PCC 7502]AFY74445.1 response regulator with CheY-like receiver domain and winged-helix DNA-binding domain [Synechococcus sp. PCC 7502]